MVPAGGGGGLSALVPCFGGGRGFRRRGWWSGLAVLFVLGLLGSVVVVSPAGSAVIKTGAGNVAVADKLPVFSACVGEALEASGFGDIEGLGAEEAISCLAYYGITVGKTAERFDPGGFVTRSQLALMLHRSAKIAGLDLKGDGAGGFDDVEGLDEERRAAIGVLTANMILSGATGDSFAPDEPATRLEVVSALVAFLRLVSPDLFDKDGSLKGVAVSKVDHFADARAALSRGDDDLVSIAYELGLTTGSAGDQAAFDPSGLVPRKNVASFVTRLLAHTNVRPVGLTAQADGRTVVVSVRDSDFMPVRAEIIDGFYVATDDEGKAFDNLGGCAALVKAIESGTTKCQVDVVDPATDADGNTRLSVTDASGSDVTVWVWSGRVGDKFDEDTEVFKLRLASLPVAASSLLVSPAQKATFHVRFGSSLEFTGQLQATVGGVTSNATVGTDGSKPAKYSLQKKTYTGQHSTVAAATAAALVSVTEAATVTSDSSGRVSFTVTASDPNPTSVGQYRTVVWTLTPSDNAPAGAKEQFVVFSDAAAVVSHVTPTPVHPFVVVNAAGVSGSNSIQVAVRDQYGVGMRNQPILLTSDLNTDTMTVSNLPKSERRTGSDGMVRIGYTQKVDTASKETITATWNGDAAGAADTGCHSANSDGKDRCGETTVLWAIRTSKVSQSSGESLLVLAGNTDTDEIIVDSDNGDPVVPHQVRYDDNDVFQLNGNYVTLAAFEAALLKALKEMPIGARLHWDSYDHDNSADIASFHLTTTTTTTGTTTTTTTTTTVSSGGATTSTTTTTTTTTTSTTTTTTTVAVAAESLTITADDATFEASKMTDTAGATYYSMKFGDWRRFTVQLKYTDENDGDKVKDATVGVDGENPVTLRTYITKVDATATTATDDSEAFVASDEVNLVCTAACGTQTAVTDVDPDNLVTDSAGRASFVVVAPADPDTSTAGTVQTRVISVVEQINGPAASGNGNKRFHFFYVLMSEGTRTTSGDAPTTTVPAGKAAAGFTVMTDGAKVDKAFTEEDTKVFVDAEFGDDVTVTVQLKDTDGADTTAGADGTGPAKFSVIRGIHSGHLTRLYRFQNLYEEEPPDNYLTGFRTPHVTGADGSFTISLRVDDPDPDTANTERSTALLIYADTNAPGATGDLNTTTAIVGIVNYREAGASTATTTTTLAAGGVAPPRDFTATASGTGVTLTWKRPSAAVGGCTLDANLDYRLLVVINSGNREGTTVHEIDIEASSDTAFTKAFAGLTVGLHYYARVSAYDSGCDAYSDLAYAYWTQVGTGTTPTTTTVPTAPAKPTGLSATPAANSVALSWTNPGDDSITGYEYRQRKGTGSWGNWTAIANSDADTTMHTVTGLDATTRYRFQIRAKNSVGNSDRSVVTDTRTTGG